MSRSGRILAIVAVEAEAKALANVVDAEIVVAGIGRTNAAAATTQAILEDGPFAAVISIGIAGALPDSGLELGELVVASESVYVEEGLETPEGFGDMRTLGFPLGEFEGNRVPA
ncbi:MAG: futalosine hydrolase, partial [Phycisphaerales bacterium]